jgi:lipooligosaccharide transport system permease protein
MKILKVINEINNNISLRFYAVFYRNFRVWLRFYKPSIIGDILEPLLFLAALGLGIGKFIHNINGTPYLLYIIPGIISSSSMYAASFEGTFGSYTRMTTKGIFDAILVTPVSIEEIVAGEVLWSAVKAFMSGLAVLLIALIFFKPYISVFILLIPIVIILNGLLFASLSLLITSFAPSYDFFSYYFTVAISTMFLFSGVFYPVSALPAIIRYIVYIMPLYYTVQITRALFLGRLDLLSLLINLLIIIIFSLIFFYLSVYFIKKRMIS